MQTIAVEETALTQHANEPQPQPETTAFVPTTTEQFVIEGEVIVIEPPEPSDDQRAPQQKPYWLLIPLTVCFCLVFVAASFLVPLLRPSATITIIPVERSITTTTAITVQARALAPLTLSQRVTAAATGILHQPARRARGTITWYNGQFASLTIAAGTIVPGTNGVRVITDQAATIPPGNPPIYGHVTVPAYAIVPGTTGNIPSFAIDLACCLPSVFAKNTQAFTGGTDARDIAVVTRTDIANAAAMLQTMLTRSLQAAVQAQLLPGEALILTPATVTATSNHQAGDAATQVHVTVAITCAGIVYTDADVNADATQVLTSQASNMLGADYAQLGDIHVTIVHATTIHIHQGRVNLVVQLSGTWVYQVTPGIGQQLVTRIAGKTQQQAAALLLSQPGIAGVQISASGGNRTLPRDPNAIRILVQYTAGHNQR
jgi:hypothetical protein